MPRLKIILVLVFTNAIFSLLLCFAYFKGANFGMKFLGIDYWFIQVPFGILNIALVALVSNLIRKYVLFFMKNCIIYSVCTKTNSLIKVLKGILKRFFCTHSIPVINSLVRNSLSELAKTMHELHKDDTISEVLQPLLNTSLISMSKNALIKMLDYVDECILGYCYAHEEKGLIKASLEAFGLFVMHSPWILGRVAVLTVMRAVITCIYYVLALALLFKFAWPLKSITLLIFYYVFVKSIFFILVDSILEPIMMLGVLESFIQLKDGADLDKLKKIVPSLNKLEQGKFEEDLGGENN